MGRGAGSQERDSSRRVMITNAPKLSTLVVSQQVEAMYRQFPQFQCTRETCASFYDDFREKGLTDDEVIEAFKALRGGTPRSFPLDSGHVVEAAKSIRRRKAALTMQRSPDDEAPMDVTMRQVAEARAKYPHLFK